MIIVGVMFMILLIGLLNLQWRNGEQYAAEAVSGLDKELRLTGNRGMILDCNGVPLAYDQNSYNVVFYKDPSKSTSKYGADYTDIIRRTIEIIEENGGTCITSFNIKVDVTDNVADYSRITSYNVCYTKLLRGDKAGIITGRCEEKSG